MHCIKCQTETPSGSQYCPACGHQLFVTPHTTHVTDPPLQTLWTGHPTIRSFEGTFFLTIFLAMAGPVLYGLSYVSPFSRWVFAMQTYVDIGWTAIAELTGLSVFIPRVSLIATLTSSLFVLACVLFIKSWVRSQQIRYRLTPEYLIVTRGFFTRTYKQLPITIINDLKLEQSFLDRLVGVGTIEADTADPSLQQVSIRGIASPTTVFDIFNRVWRDTVVHSPSKTPSTHVNP